MILRTTQKVRDKIVLKKIDDEAPGLVTRFLEEWYVNTVAIERRQYLIFSEASTLYTVIAPSKGIASRKKLEELSIDILFNLIKRNVGINGKLFESLAASVIITKAQSRSILSSMNQLTLIAQCGSANWNQGFDGLNDIILGAIEYDSPRDAFAKAVNSLDMSQY